MSEPQAPAEAQPNTEAETEAQTAPASSLLAGETTEQSEQQEPEPTTDSTDTEQASEQETEGEKPEEKPEGAPEKYEFKNPEGLPEEVDDAIADAYADAARELDLPQDRAQALYEKTMGAFYKHAESVQAAQTAEWHKSIKEDSEIGGESLKQNLAAAQKAVAKFGSDGLQELVKMPHGIGDHPEMVRFLVRVGKAISEDRFVGPDKGNGRDPNAPLTQEEHIRRLYPNTK